MDFEVTCSGLAKGEPPEPCVVVIFGITGDLARHDLIPALFALYCQKLLPERFAVIGFARKPWDDEALRREMRPYVEKAVTFDDRRWQEFARRLHYVAGDFHAPPAGAYANLKQRIAQAQQEYGIPDNVLFHLSTPPSYYGTIMDRLAEASLLREATVGGGPPTGWRRVIVEKPFGMDEASARALDRALLRVIGEDQLYRIDHYLGKETVQNMLAFRFANPGFEPIWNRRYIDHVQITVAEAEGIGTRGLFYEQTGVVRDMIQNHLLNLVCMAAMEPPVRYDACSLRDETVKVLRSIRPLDVQRDCVLGQYGPGQVDDKPVAGYREEENVDPHSTVPTFAAIKLYLDNWRWAGVPFYLRTGKRLPRKLTSITVQFKPTPHLMFPLQDPDRLQPNIVTFRLQPDEGILYTFLAKQPGPGFCLRPVTMNFRYDRTFGIERMPGAYQWLLLDAMHGDQTLFPRSDWIYRAWSIVDPLLRHWEANPPRDLPNYAAGTWGPTAADRLLAQDGRTWYAV